jgi:hypothetical protein
MDEETQKELMRLVKQSLVVIAGGRRDEELLYALRDIIRKIESKGGEAV